MAEGLVPGEGEHYLQQLQDAGVPQAQIDQWRAHTEADFQHGGVTQDQIDDYFGAKHPNMSNAVQAVKGLFPAAAPATGETSVEGATPRTPEGIYQDLASSWQHSVLGLATGGKPTFAEPEDLGLVSSLLSGAVGAAGDSPATLAGMLLGGPAGGAVGGAIGSAVPAVGTAAGAAVGTGLGEGFGAAALPAALRTVLMDHYNNSQGPWTFKSFMGETAKAMIAGVKSGAVGAISAGVGGAAERAVARGLAPSVESGLLSAGVSKFTAGAAASVAYAGTAVGVSAAWNRRAIDRQDITTAVGLALGWHVGGELIGVGRRFVISKPPGEQMFANLSASYAVTGVNPTQAVLMAHADPAIHTEIVAPLAADGTPIMPALMEHAPPEPGLPGGGETEAQAESRREQESADAAGAGAEAGEAETAVREEDVTEEGGNAIRENALRAVEHVSGHTREQTQEYMAAHANQVMALQGSGGDTLPPNEPPSEPTGSQENVPPTTTVGEYTGLKIPPPSTTLAYEMMGDRIQSKPVPGMNLWKTLQGFRARLAPVRDIDYALRMDRSKMTSEDWLRQTFASDGRAASFLMEGPAKWTKNAKGDWSVEAAGDASPIRAAKEVAVAGGNMDHFWKRLYAVRAEFLRQRGISHPFDMKAVEAILSDRADGEKYQTAFGTWKESHDALMDYAQGSGLYDTERTNTMKTLDPFYISFQRVVDPSFNPPRAGSSFGVRQPIRKIEGSKELNVIDPETSTVNNYYSLVAASDLNRGKAEAIKMILEKQDKNFPQITLPQDNAFDLDNGDWLKQEVLDNDGNVVAPEIIDALKPFLMLRKFAKKSDPRRDVMYFDKGKPVVVQVMDPGLAEVLNQPSMGSAPLLVNIAARFAAFARTGISVDPSFALRSIMHQQVSGSTFAENPVGPFTPLLGGIGHALEDKGFMRQWVLNGGVGSALADIDTNYFKKRVHQAFTDSGTSNMVLNAVLHPIEAMRTIQHYADSATRAGYAMKMRAKGFGDLKAATMSRTAYLDHAEGRGFTWLNYWARTVPFMNIAMKDIDQVVDGFKHRPFQTAMRVTTNFILPTIALHLLNTEFDKTLPPGQKSTDLPAWERDMYWTLPPIGGARLRIMKPYVGGFLFSTIVDRMMDKMLKEQPDAYKGVASAFWRQATPPLMPTLLSPVAEQLANKNLYTGRPIVPSSLENVSPWLQYTPNTTMAAEGLARALGPRGLDLTDDASPMMIDNYMREWGGTAPMQAGNLMADIGRALGVPFPKPEGIRSISDTPFLGSFFARRPLSAAQPITDFYDDYDKFAQKHADFMVSTKRGDVGDAQWAARNGGLVTLSRMRRAMGAQTAALRMIEQSSMTNAEKVKYTDQIASNMATAAKYGSEIIRQIEAAQ